MKLIEVTTTDHKREFLDMAVRLYSNDSNWIRPLDKDVEGVFDPRTNKYFANGEAARWLLYDEQNVCVGRVAAFINRRSEKKKTTSGGMGFFECINDQTAANLLFNQCFDWLQARGMVCMDGPINFGDRDRWWGCLVEGFEPPVYCMNYNRPYYHELFEGYGFETYFEQFCYSLRTDVKLEPHFYERAEILDRNPDYKAIKIDSKNLEKYAHDFVEIYNKAWVRHDEGAKMITFAVAMKILKSVKPILVEDLMWFIYYKNEPVAFWLNLPEINQIVKHLNGKFGWWQKLKFWYLLKTGYCTKFYGIIFGVVPDHQGKGVDSYMIVHGAAKILKHTNFTNLELTWIGDFNPKMNRIARSLGTERSRKLITYRKMFDPGVHVERLKSI